MQPVKEGREHLIGFEPLPGVRRAISWFYYRLELTEVELSGWTRWLVVVVRNNASGRTVCRMSAETGYGS